MLQVFGRAAFEEFGQYFRALRLTSEGEGKHRQVCFAGHNDSCQSDTPAQHNQVSQCRESGCSFVNNFVVPYVFILFHWHCKIS